jgi:hypothetical protein
MQAEHSVIIHIHVVHISIYITLLLVAVSPTFSSLTISSLALVAHNLNIQYLITSGRPFLATDHVLPLVKVQSAGEWLLVHDEYT